MAAIKKSFWFKVLAIYVVVILLLMLSGLVGMEDTAFKHCIDWTLHKVVLSGMVLAIIWLFKNMNK